MRGALNDALRRLIAVALRIGGGLGEARHRLRVRYHHQHWLRLRRRLQIQPDTELASSVPQVKLPSSGPTGGSVRLVSTSGSTGTAKVVAYPRGRTEVVRWVFVDSFMRAFWAFDIRRTSMYIFGPVRGDDSLTSLLLDESGRPPYLAILQAPYRIHAWNRLRHLHDTYGTNAVRLWVLALSNPGVLYSTNPSTMSTFFDELEADWLQSSALVRDIIRGNRHIDPSLADVTRRLASRGFADRFRAIADSSTYLPIDHWAPAATAYSCWTGGYVSPFLDRLDEYLPKNRFLRIPMYSMSTETIETITDFRLGEVAFLPMAPGVCCEFLDHSAPREPGSLLPPRQLSVGGVYELVVSHSHGLRRYRTGDLFRVRRFVANLPDLQFLRRRGLTYSFTGEKLTGTQAMLAYDLLRTEFPDTVGDLPLTCFPCRRPATGLPHYRIVAVYSGRDNPGQIPGLAQRFDELLCESNSEYRAKRASGRLGPVRQESASLLAMRTHLSDRLTPGVESQFKLLPLYPRLWEERNLP